MKLIGLIFTLCLITNFYSAQNSLNVNVIFQWDDPTIPAEPFYNLNYNEVWGVAINDREYAIIGSSIGTHIFDVTDPANFRIEGRVWQGRRRYYFTVPYGPYYIWGATARILRGLADRLSS